MIRPYALETFGANPPLRRAIEQVLNFVGKTSVTSLGFVGLLLLLYAASSLLRNIEEALNDIWDAPTARGPLQQLTHYVAIIVVTPTCLLLAAAVGTLAQSSHVLRWLESVLGIGEALEWTVARLGPLVIVFIGLLFLYGVMPNTHVRARSAVIGAAIGSVLWYGALILHVRFQVGVAGFNALYSGFAALPIFLVWVDVSWRVVLVGAEVAATHQHERVRAQRRRAAKTSQAVREALCLSALLRIARAALDSEPPPSLQGLSAALDAPEPLLHDVLQRQAVAGLVVKAGTDADPQWVLARVPEHIKVKDVLDALRNGGHVPLHEAEGLDPLAVDALVGLEHEMEQADANRSLREVLED
jgi:membrane protein